MKVVTEAGTDDLAKVYVAELGSGKFIEFAESLQPPLSINEKWVLTLSTLHGCPVGCGFCDANGWYDGKLTCDEILEQADFMVGRRFSSREVPVRKFKIQFARVGEPSLNDAVLDALEELHGRYIANGLMMSVSTVAPKGRDSFFERLMEIKNQYYCDGSFQMQFSIHTTDERKRDAIIPVWKWSFDDIAIYSSRFYNPPHDRKVTLNFALAVDYPFDPDILAHYFDPEIFLIKITPLNPTISVMKNNLRSYIDLVPETERREKIVALKNAGYEVLVSIGDRNENLIGSNCGQYLQKMALIT